MPAWRFCRPSESAPDPLYAAARKVKALLDRFTADQEAAAAAEHALAQAKARDDDATRRQQDDATRRDAEEMGATVFDPPIEAAPARRLYPLRSAR